MGGGCVKAAKQALTEAPLVSSDVATEQCIVAFPDHPARARRAETRAGVYVSAAVRPAQATGPGVYAQDGVAQVFPQDGGARPQRVAHWPHQVHCGLEWGP